MVEHRRVEFRKDSGKLNGLRQLEGTMSLLWLRFALACYLIGLVYAFVALSRTSDLFSRIALHAVSLGMVFHFVSLVEVFVAGKFVWASMPNGESLLAFISMSFFMLIYAIYKTTSPGIVVFPVVFILTFIAAVDQQPVLLTEFVSHKGWLVAHIILIFTGYAALVVIDQIGYRSLLVGFPFMTLGLLTGLVVAVTAYGHVDFLDPLILLSV